MIDGKKIYIIVAIAKNNAIGKNGDLLWHLSDDLKRFKSITSGHTVIMGRKTFESFGSRALPKRRNIVITSNEKYKAENVEIVHSFQKAIDVCRNEKEIFIIGGSQVYEEFLDVTDKLYLTIVDAVFEDADTFFPELNFNNWELVYNERVEASEKNDYAYNFKDFIRK